MNTDEPTRCGFVAIVGRPNVGKSTLLNALLGQKLSITSPKPQTTRHRICGIRSIGHDQFVYLDTPGLHRDAKRALNKAMNRAVGDTLADADVIVFVVEGMRWHDEDADVLQRLEHSKTPVIVALNKVDLVRRKTELLPYLQKLSARHPFEAIVPLAALKDKGIDLLQDEIAKHLPAGPWMYPPEQLTDRSESFQIAEIIREKLMLRLDKELPYGIVVEVESLQREKRTLRIGATIWVERKGQKSIVIGKGGGQLKEIGKAARHALEQRFGGKVFLELWVREKTNWSDDARALRSLGHNFE